MPFRRRCLLFVPGDSERKIGRALALEADGLIFDLEDSVGWSAKSGARAVVSAALEKVRAGSERVIRVNGPASGLTAADIEGTIGAKPDAYMLPKVSSAAEVVQIAEMVERAEARGGLPHGTVKLILIATETPAGVLNIGSLATAHARVSALMWGAEDLSAALGVSRTRGPDGRLLDVFAHARMMTVLAAAAAGIDALDTPYIQIQDMEGLREEARAAAATGFCGKAAIHPDQVAPIMEAFTLDPAEVGGAQDLIAAWQALGQPGTFAHRGQMIDAPHLERARSVLRRAGVEPIEHVGRSAG